MALKGAGFPFGAMWRPGLLGARWERPHPQSNRVSAHCRLVPGSSQVAESAVDRGSPPWTQASHHLRVPLITFAPEDTTRPPGGPERSHSADKDGMGLASRGSREPRGQRTRTHQASTLDTPRPMSGQQRALSSRGDLSKSQPTRLILPGRRPATAHGI